MTKQDQLKISKQIMREDATMLNKLANNTMKNTEQVAKIFDLPEFKLSPNGRDLKRLIYRYYGIIENNIPNICNKSIIDIGFHDGRWSYAAALSGAKKIQGIEINNLCIDSGSDKLITGLGAELKIYHDDIINVIDDIESADTLLCLGFLYHTFDVVEILRRMAKKINFLILDTQIPNLPNMQNQNILKNRPEFKKVELLTNTKTKYVSEPTLPALYTILDHCGFTNIQLYDYSQNKNTAEIGKDKDSKVGDYTNGRRVTITAQIEN